MNDELKELLKNAKSEEEAKKILDKHRDELSDADLESIAGGEMGHLPTIGCSIRCR